jgi:hypothetical protein
MTPAEMMAALPVLKTCLGELLAHDSNQGYLWRHHEPKWKNAGSNTGSDEYIDAGIPDVSEGILLAVA